MSEQGLDPSISELIYQVGDTASDPAQAAEQLRGVLARLEGSQHPGLPSDPGGGSAIQPEATPRPAAGPAASFGELAQQIPDLQRAAAAAAAGGDPQAAHDLVWDLADRFNATADQHLREQRPYLYGPGPQAAHDDAGLQELRSRVEAAHADPGSVDQEGLLRLVEQVNQTVEGIRVDRERHADDTERQRQAAERQRSMQRRREAPIVEQLERLLAQARAGQPAGGRAS